MFGLRSTPSHLGQVGNGVYSTLSLEATIPDHIHKTRE